MAICHQLAHLDEFGKWALLPHDVWPAYGSYCLKHRGFKHEKPPIDPGCVFGRFLLEADNLP